MPASNTRECFSEFIGLAPVPPSWPDTSTTSLSAFATPAATGPMPDCETSLVEMRASGFARFRSKISCFRSSIE